MNTALEKIKRAYMEYEFSVKLDTSEKFLDMK